MPIKTNKPAASLNSNRLTASIRIPREDNHARLIDEFKHAEEGAVIFFDRVFILPLFSPSLFLSSFYIHIATRSTNTRYPIVEEIKIYTAASVVRLY